MSPVNIMQHRMASAVLIATLKASGQACMAGDMWTPDTTLSCATETLSARQEADQS